MRLQGDLVARAASVADRSWCRLVNSPAGEQVLAAYQDRRPLVAHLVRCPECAEAAGGYLRLSDELGDSLSDCKWIAPPDFVDRVVTNLKATAEPSTSRRSPKDKAVLVGAAALGGSAVVAAALARHRRTAA